MDKKPIIMVSVCAVVLLILASLTNVVGYQSVKSTVNDSPLFNIRTQKSTNQHLIIFTSYYLGKDKRNHLQFPTKDFKIESMKKAIKFISKMNDKTFVQFTEWCLQQATQIDSLRNTNHNEIKTILLLSRTNPETIIYTLSNRDNESVSTLFLCVIELILGILGFLLALLFVFLNTTAYTVCAVWECNK